MPHASFRVLLIGLCVLACAFSARAEINAWSFHGPIGGGGNVLAVATHPGNAAIALAGTPRGIHRSTDGGLTWMLVKDDLMNQLMSVEFDPSNPSRVIANDGRLYLSHDSGQTFGVMQGPDLAPGDIFRFIAFGSDGRLYALTIRGTLFASVAPFTNWTSVSSQPSNSTTTFLTIDPTNPQVVYIGLYTQGILRSTDGGANWSTPLTAGVVNPQTTSYLQLAVDPADPTRLLVATGLGVYLSTNTGATGTLRDPNLAYWVGFEPDEPGVAYAQIPGNLIRSLNSGTTWTSVWNHRAESVGNVGFITGVTGGLFVATSQGLGYSSNAGLSVVYRNTGLTGFMPWSLEASDDTVFLGLPAGTGDIFRRSGTTYAPLDPTPLLAATTNTRRIMQMAVAAGDSQQIFAVNSFTELIRTFDGGAHWTSPHPAFTVSGEGSIHDVQIDPSNPLIAYVARDNGVWRTIDGGTTFTHLANSPTNGAGVLGVSPHDGSILIATDPVRGLPAIYKSSNGGSSWTETLPAPTINDRRFISFTFHPTDPDEVYAAAYYGGVYKSTDGGDSWARMSFEVAGETYVPAYAVLFDRMFPTTLFVASTGSKPGFLRSVDSGATWESTFLETSGTPIYLGYAVLDPNNPDRLIATSTSAGVAEYQIAPDMGLAMASMASALPTGGAAGTSFTVTNFGPHASSASAIRINVPAWLTPSGPGCTRTGQTLVCLLGAIKVGESRSVPVTFAVGPSPQSTGQIDATLETHELDTETANNIAGQSVSAAEIADVDVEISGAQTVDHGSSTDVSVNVSNSGPSPATAVEVLLHLPANMSVSGLATSRGSCTQAAGIINCPLGTLAVGSSASITFALRGDVVGHDSLVASANGQWQDPDGVQNDVRAFTVRPVADLAVTISESADPVTVGTDFQYIATVTNITGDAGSFSVSIPVIGAGVTAATADFGACLTSSNTVTCVSNGLAAGGTGTVTVNLSATVAGIATATATVNSPYTDPDPANNSATIGTTLRLVGDLSVEITDSMDPATTGIPFSYTGTVRNLGPNAGAVHLVVQVTGATVSSATLAGDACTNTASAVTCDITSLGSDASAALSIGVSASAAGTATATATVTYTGIDPVATNNTATASTTVNAPPPPPGSSSGGGSSGGGGGGGRFDWLALGLLGLLLTGRRARPEFHQ